MPATHPRPTPDFMASMSLFSALEGQAPRRIRKTAEDPPRVSVYDVIGAMSGLNSGNCANVWKRLLEAYPDVLCNMPRHKFPGQGQRWTPVCTEQGVHDLLPLLSSHNVAMSRATGVWQPVKRRRAVTDDLYIMCYSTDSTAVKIGRSQDVGKRKRSLEAGQNFMMHVLAVFPEQGPLETRVHECLADKRSTQGAGTEWFQIPTQEAVSLVGNIVATCRSQCLAPCKSCGDKQ